MTMPKDKALTKQESVSIADLRALGQEFFISKLFPDMQSAAQAVVKISAGRELGFGPVYSMTKIYIVKGHIMVSAEAMGAMVKRSERYDYKVVKHTDAECEIAFTDNNKPEYVSRFTMEDARRAGLLREGGSWATWPKAMLFSKALSQGARIVCPHVISGTYTPEDFGYSVNPDTDQLEAPPVVEVIKPEPPKEPYAEVADDIMSKDKPPTLVEEAGKVGAVLMANKEQIAKMKDLYKEKGLDPMQLSDCAQEAIGRTPKTYQSFTSEEAEKMIEALQNWGNDP